jgi:hypothetical protein
MRAQPLAPRGDPGAGRRGPDQRQRGERGHAVPQEDPQHGPGERVDRTGRGGQRGLVGEQLTHDDGGPGLHDVEDGGHDPAPDRVPQRRREVDERPPARDTERHGPDQRVDRPSGGHLGQRRAHDPESREAHRGDRPGQALGQRGVEVHAQARSLRRWDRVEGGDGA